MRIVSLLCRILAPTFVGLLSVPLPVQAQPTRSFLYEEVKDTAGRKFVGSVIWRTEIITPEIGQPSELAIRADVDVPVRKLSMALSLRCNSNSNPPASHIVDIVFRPMPDFSVENVPAIVVVMPNSQGRGTPLAAKAAKVASGAFVIGLSAIDTDRERNEQLLMKETAWFHIPVIYNGVHRAVVAIEKGLTGQRVFAEAFAEWRRLCRPRVS